jgi:hypothetical protein
LQDSVAEFNPHIPHYDSAQHLIREVIPSRKEIKMAIIDMTQDLLPSFERINFNIMKADSWRIPITKSQVYIRLTQF